MVLIFPETRAYLVVPHSCTVKTRNLLIWAAITLLVIIAAFAWFVVSGGLDQLFRPEL